MCRKGVDDLSINRGRLHANAFDQVPRKVLLQQELGLFAFFQAATPVGRLYRRPIDFTKTRQVIAVFKKYDPALDRVNAQRTGCALAQATTAPKSACKWMMDACPPW